MFLRHYDLDGCVVRACVADRDLAQVLDRLLESYPVTEGTPDVTLTIERSGEASAPLATRPDFVFPPLEIRRTAEGLHLRDTAGELEVRAQEGLITGRIACAATSREIGDFVRLAVWTALLECLRARGRYALHAAAAVSPAGETVLFAGTRAAGKSTILIALLEQGWTALSDDTIFLLPSGEVQPFRRRFHVRLDFLARRPDLAAYAEDVEGLELADKRFLRLERLFADRLAHRAPRPSRVYFCEIIDAPHSEVVEIDRKQSLLRLLEHSCSVFFLTELAQPHLDELGTLASTARGFRLRCGRDVLLDPSRYLELLARRELAA